jgi:hypothetical protein
MQPIPPKNKTIENIYDNNKNKITAYSRTDYTRAMRLPQREIMYRPKSSL